MQEKTPILYILCGLTNADSEEFKTEIAKVAKENQELHKIIYTHQNAPITVRNCP